MAPRLCTALALLVVTAFAVTPIEKVTTLLEDLQKDIEKEGEEEAKAYDKFACFCKDTTKDKSKNIEEQQDKIDSLNADIGKKTAEREEKIENREKEQQKQEETERKLEETTEQYRKDKAVYEATNADLTKAVNSAKRAHKALSESKGAAFLEGAKSDVQNCLDLADALNLVPSSTHEAVTSFLQVDPDDPAYKFHSDKILKIIKDLQNDFDDERKKVRDEWKKTDETYKSEKKDLEDKIQTAKDEIKKLTGEIDKLKADIAKLKEDLEKTESSLADDSAYLKDLTVRCEDKANAWDARTVTRNGEVEAIKKALKIMKSDKVKEQKRALLISKKPASAAAVAAPKAPAKVNKPADVKPVKATKPAVAAKATVKKSLSFLQAGSKTRRAQDQAIAILRQESIRLDSSMLSSVADQIAKDPFTKIKKMIQGLIERLLEESKQEATKKGFCDTELGKSYEDRKNRYADINRLDADLSELEAHQKELEDEIDQLTEDLKNLRKDLKKATELREDEKDENEKTIKQAKEGAVAVGEALVILKDFYKSAAKAKLLLQVAASPVDEDDPGAGFDGAYRGSQSSSKGIIGLLEVIKSDFERTDRKTTAAEAKAHADFINFERTSKSDIAGKDTKKALDEQDLETTKSAIEQGMKDMKTAMKLLDSALKNVEDLKPVCIDTGMSYKERVKKREEEIKALGEALKALQPK